MALFFILSMATRAALPAAADDVARGFAAKGHLETGWVVALSKDKQGTVEAAPPNDSSRIYGVVIDPNDAPVTLNRQSGDQVFVATSGTYPVLTSTQRGSIKPGDFLSISSTSGIAALADYEQSSIVGRAAAAFDGKSGALSSGNGYAVGRINVNIEPRKNPLVKNDIAIPSFLRKIGEAVAGKPVSALRIYVALAILFTAVVLATTLLWASVKGGMIAMGRNPLNRAGIMNSMFRVVTAASVIFIVGLFGVYLLLRI